MLAMHAQLLHSDYSILEARSLKLAACVPDCPSMSECLIDVIVDRFLDAMDGIGLLMRQVPLQGSHSRLPQPSAIGAFLQSTQGASRRTKR